MIFSKITRQKGKYHNMEQIFTLIVMKNREQWKSNSDFKNYILTTPKIKDKLNFHYRRHTH